MSWWFWNTRLYKMGPKLNYEELNPLIQRAQRKWRRNWIRTDYMAYWKRGRNRSIELRAGWRCTSPSFSTGERILLLHRDGRVTISVNIGAPYERTRLNHYFPFNKRWHFWWWRDALMVSRIPEGKGGWDCIGDPTAVVIEPRYYMKEDVKGNNRVRSRYIEFDADGEPIKPFRGMRFKTYKRLTIKEQNRQQQPRKRGWYWTRRARNLFRNDTGCRGSDLKIPWEKRPHCAAGRWERNPPQTYECGCVTYRKTYKRPFGKTVQQILDEPNATVRAAWMQIYGIQKFFVDAGSDVIDRHGKYQLLRLETGVKNNAERRTITAVKMTCPSTGTVYISSVPGNIISVSQAMDWMYDYRGYLANVGQQT